MFTSNRLSNSADPEATVAEDVLAAMDVGDETSVVEGQAFLDTLLKQQTR